MRRRLVAALAIIAALGMVITPMAALADAATWEKVTVAATAIGLSAGTISPSGRPVRKACLLTLETAQVRWRVDGTNPDASTGHLMDPGGAVTIRGGTDLTAFRAIRVGGTSGVLSASCW